MSKPLAAVAILALMLGFGFGVYRLLESGGGGLRTPDRPTANSGVARLPGTIYVAQGGALYSLQAGRFKQLTPAQGWTEPAISPDGKRLIAVKRTLNYSDLYLLTPSGQVQSQLTFHASSVVEDNHWSFYPHFSSDGGTVFYSYDPKNPTNSYAVDLAIYALPLTGSNAIARAWSSPNFETGGDVDPTPLRSGGLIYAKYSISDAGQPYSQVWIQARAGSPGLGLTTPDENCGQPALSPDQSSVVMVCEPAGSTGAQLEMASLNTSDYSIGAPRILAAGVEAASPTFSPDASLVSYFAPAAVGATFQLWTVSTAAPVASKTGSPAPSVPTPQVDTHNLSLDSTAGAAWA